MRALQYLSGNNIIHNDIKPSNFMVTKEKQIKIIDFGLATFQVEETMIGTPGYVDPYKYKASKGTHSSDMFSLGVTFLELLIPEFPSLLKQRVRDLNATDNMKDNDISLQYERVNNDQKYRKFLIDDVINKYLPKEHHSIKSLLFYLLGATYISGSPPTATGALQQLEYIQKKRRLI